MLEKIQGIVDVSGSRDRLPVSMDDGDNPAHLVRYVQGLEMISKHEVVMSGVTAGSSIVEAKNLKFKATTRRLAYLCYLRADF